MMTRAHNIPGSVWLRCAVYSNEVIPSKGFSARGLAPASISIHKSLPCPSEHAVLYCERIANETISDLVRVLGLREPLLVGLGHGKRYARGGTIGLDLRSPKTRQIEDPLEGCTADSLCICRDGLSLACKECQLRASWFSWRRQVMVVLRM